MAFPWYYHSIRSWNYHETARGNSMVMRWQCHGPAKHCHGITLTYSWCRQDIAMGGHGVAMGYHAIATTGHKLWQSHGRP